MLRPCSNLLLSLLVTSSASAVTIDWVPIGEPGNLGDPQESCIDCGPGTMFGSVSYTYQISSYEVTNAQYVEFLNAVADTDTNGLYNTSMGTGWGGITRSGSSGSYSYSAIAGRENMPVIFVSFYDSLRFANWLHNGQLSGAQDATTTDDGAYTITAQGISDNSITRNAGAAIFLPSEDEWYKAAYYDAQSASYFDYPAGSDAQTTCTAPTATPNSANCGNAIGDLTGVGSYTGSASPYGTFDQGGNVWEWNEAIIIGSDRVLRGGHFDGSTDNPAASIRIYFDLASGDVAVGFRVAPEPGRDLLLVAGVLGVLGLAGWRGARD